MLRTVLLTGKLYIVASYGEPMVRAETETSHIHNISFLSVEKPEGMLIRGDVPSRLHFGFIDTDEKGFLAGSAGMAIDFPRMLFTVSHPTDSSEIIPDATATADPDTGEEFLSLLRKAFSHPTIKNRMADGGATIQPHVRPGVHFKTAIPRHVGLGSGTQMALSAGKVASILSDVDVPIDDLARFFGRGKRSRIGIEVFRGGGFIIHSAGKECVKRYTVPDEWRFVVTIPDVKEHVYGHKEEGLLGCVRPLTEDERENLIDGREDMVRGVLGRDIEAFGAGLQAVDTVTGRAFSAAQGGTYSYRVVEKGVEFALKNGSYGSGQSSWGPGFFSVTPDEETAERLAEAMKHFVRAHGGGHVFIARPRNHGAIFEVEENL